MLHRFANCTLDTDRYTLHRAGQIIELRPKIFTVLTYLLTHRDRPVSKQELADQLWPNQMVSDAAIEGCMKQIRQALGDSGREQRVIQTRRGHGYQFVAAVTSPPGHDPGDQALSELEAEPLQAVSHEALNRPHTTMIAAPTPTLSGQEMADRVGEWKVATILCCALTPTLVSPTRSESEIWYRRMKTLYRYMQPIVKRYDGHLQPIVGDQIVAVFGAPMSQEDHALRAVFGALELRHSLSAAPAIPALSPADFVPLVVHMGIHSGEIVVGGGQDDQSEPGLAIGNVATRASTLQEAAAPGMILCSTATARLVQDRVRLVVHPPTSVVIALMTEPVYQLVGHAGQRLLGLAPGLRPEIPFVGRQPELTMLDALLKRVALGQGHAVALVGEPGIGKSRLVYEFRSSLQGQSHIYLQGRCSAYGRSTPYLPILDLLRHVCGIMETDCPEALTTKIYRCLEVWQIEAERAAPYLLHLLLGTSAELENLTANDPQVHKTFIFEILLQVFLSASRQQLTVIEVEDLHWIDATSEAWLAMLVERFVDVPLLLLITSRRGYHPPWHAKSYATQLALTPLASHDGRELVQAILPTQRFPDTLIREIVVKAGGNPLFLSELARAVLEAGHDHLPQHVPDTIQAVVAARLDQIPPVAKRLLQMAAVIGDEIPLPLLQAFTIFAEERLKSQLQYLQAVELIYKSRAAPHGVYHFKHVLIQDVAYQSLLMQTRQIYHQRLAEIVVTQFAETAERHPERVAHHYTEAALYPQAVQWWQRASQNATDHWAFIEAMSHASKGLEIVRTQPETPACRQLELELSLTLARSLHRVKGGADAESGRAFARAFELRSYMDKPSQLFFTLHGLRRFHMSRGNCQTAHRFAKQLFDLAECSDDAFCLLGACYSLGYLIYQCGDAPTAHAYLERGLTLVDACQPLSRFYDLLCRSTMACTLWALGHPNRARTYALDIIGRVQPGLPPQICAQALWDTSFVYQSCGELQLACDQIENVITLATQWGLPMWLAVAKGAYGGVLSKLGQSELGITEIRESLAVCRVKSAKLYALECLAWLAEAYRDDGQIEAGLRAVTEGLTLVDNIQGHRLAPELYRLQGELLLAASDNQRVWEQAEVCLHRALATAERQGAKSLELRAATSLGRLWQRQGRATAARQLLTKRYHWFTEGFDTADLREANALLHDLI